MINFLKEKIGNFEFGIFSVKPRILKAVKKTQKVKKHKVWTPIDRFLRKKCISKIMDLACCGPHGLKYGTCEKIKLSDNKLYA